MTGDMMFTMSIMAFTLNSLITYPNPSFEGDTRPRSEFCWGGQEKSGRVIYIA